MNEAFVFKNFKKIITNSQNQCVSLKQTIFLSNGPLYVYDSPRLTF